MKLLKLQKKAGIFYAGEEAGFDDEEAAKLVQIGAAVYVVEDSPVKKPVLADEIQTHADQLLTKAETEAAAAAKAKAPRDIGAELTDAVQEIKSGGGRRSELDMPDDDDVDDSPRRGPGRPRKNP